MAHKQPGALSARLKSDEIACPVTFFCRPPSPTGAFAFWLGNFETSQFGEGRDWLQNFFEVAAVYANYAAAPNMTCLDLA